MTTDKTLQMEAEQAAKEKYPTRDHESVSNRMVNSGLQEAYLEGYLARAAKEGWQDISTAPTEGIYLVYGGVWYGDWQGPHQTSIAHLIERKGGQFIIVGSEYYEPVINHPTHWHPLPNPPQSPSHDKE